MFWLWKIWNQALEIIYPPVYKIDDIKLNQTLFCSICKARLANNKKICHRSASYVLAAATSYSDKRIRKWIWQLKYRGKTGNAALLANLLIRYFENLKLKIENFVLVPIPISKKRLRERGYNQSTLIAKVVAEKFGFPLLEGSLTRQRDTPPQAEIKDWDQRKKNVAGCFGVINPALIKNKNVIVVDDVYTSGSTMTEAVHQLKDFGAKQVIGLVVARAS